MKSFFRSPILFFSLILTACIWSSCKDDISGAGITDIVFPDTGVSYGGQMQPLFDRGCAFEGCHAGAGLGLGLSLENYQNTISSDPGVVLARDTVNSRLIWSVEGLHGTRKMPPDRTPLNTNQTKGIRRWILEGARNN
jgi:hypothetical protein